ncbi:Chemotaxis phosphatase CheX [Sanguibacter gelidistatuariae]|uniref:Chemotaxis phosphatase CheX n=1 Tax=Sanguibacter gelidistatuariae TaxID=1814289 RepID=A0A1G6Q161_9MICO|nr:chemotaxis protein CheX [Sanguibacter gelidistatuariae]SDC85941.1 Chemotaxis phosphatase CheX [Sanguibacter gelidistatuariae]
MSTALVVVAKDQILAITQDVFAAMIDGGEVLITERAGAAGEFVDPVCAWVDMTVAALGLGARAVVRTETAAAHELTRALLMMDASEFVGPEDLADAFGELANVVGGNVKSLLAAPAVLSLPTVAAHAPELGAGQFLQDLTLDWRGHILVVSLWMLG